MLSIIAMLLPLAAAAPTSSFTCFDLEIPMSFNATSFTLDFPPWKNHYDSVEFLDRFTARNFRQLPSPLNGSHEIVVNVVVAASYCSPANNGNGVVQLLSHGLGFDMSYWSFNGSNSQYSYVKAATDAGYATLAYDRIGDGKSTKTDPYTINQMQIEVQVLAILTEHLRKGDLPALKSVPLPKKVVHVGHSYGSQIGNHLVTSYPTISDGLVQTGFSANNSPSLAVASNFHLAKENQPRRFANLSTGYVTWGDELANQYSFFHWPNFSPKILAESEATKWPFSVGEMLTGGGSQVAKNFTAPVLILSGEYDNIFCGGGCYGVLQNASALFPAAKPFQTYVQPDTAHGINLHYNSTGAYKVMNDFIGQYVKP